MVILVADVSLSRLVYDGVACHGTLCSPLGVADFFSSLCAIVSDVRILAPDRAGLEAALVGFAEGTSSSVAAVGVLNADAGARAANIGALEAFDLDVEAREVSRCDRGSSSVWPDREVISEV